MADKTVKCPECGTELPLKVRDGDPAHLVAHHDCNGRGFREVYLTDAEPTKQAEPVKPAKSKGE